MSKRLKFAKLRLASLDECAAAPPVVSKEEQEGFDNYTSENIMKSCKKSKFFTTECSSQNTFIEADDDRLDEHNKGSNGHNSRRRTVSEHEVCSAEGPKMPKLRKKLTKETGVISQFLNASKSEDDDFEETRQNVVAQPKQTKVQRAVRKKVQKQPKRQSDIRKIFKKCKSDHGVLHKLIKEHSASEQIDPEELQMALAMSRSLVDQECSSSASSSTEIHKASGSCSVSLEERRIVGIRTTLEQFGFRCKNSYTDYDLNVIFGAGCKNVKKIKHKRATNLQRRTSNELVDFINLKTKTIFPVEMVTLGCGTDVQHPPVNLQSYLTNLFWMAQTEQTSNQLLVKYYGPELVEVTPAPVGCLLKDWSKIPGREATPERNSCKTITSLNSSLSQACSVNRSARATSPDLFDEFENSVCDANLCDNSTDPINHFERTEKNKVSEDEDLVGDGLMIHQLNHDRSALFVPSGDPNETDGNKPVGNTQICEPVAPIDKGPENKQESNRLLFNSVAEEMDETDAGNCTNANIPEANDDVISVLDSSSAETPTLHRSAENIFDETDIEPIVSFEVFSSEEEKISSNAAQKSTLSKEDVDPPIASIRSEQCFRPHSSNQSFIGCISGVIEEEEEAVSPKDATTIDNAGPCGLQPFGEEKLNSFNRIAVKARISEALQNSAFRVETVDLVDCTASAHETSEDDVENVEKSNLQCPAISRVINDAKDDAPYISEDVVNDSIRELPRLPVDAEEDDLNKTEIYYCPESGTHGNGKENEGSVLSNRRGSEDNGRLLVESVDESMSSHSNGSESGAEEPAVKSVESTFAYLERLIKQYDLPSLQLRNTNNNGYVNSSFLENSKSNSPVLRPEKSVDEFVPLKPIVVSDSLETYKIPHFKENIEFKRIHQDTSSNLYSTATSCCQQIFPKHLSNYTNTIASNPGPLVCSQDTKQNRFFSKFHELNTVRSSKECPEFQISVEHADFGPPSFEHMSTSEIEFELFKYGLKDLSRSKAIQVLQLLFEKTHMFVDVQQIVKHDNENVITNTLALNPFATSPLLSEHYHHRRSCAFKLDLNADDIFLPLKPRKKIAWSAVPLHITFFNLVSESVRLQRKILLYQPVNFDEIYSALNEVGLRYETKDLMAFLDKRCITFRCAPSNGDRTKQNAKCLKE